MQIAASDAEAREALAALNSSLLKITELSPDSESAKRSLRLLSRYEHLALDKETCDSIGADLTKGLSEWAWNDASWSTLCPLIDDLSGKLVRRIEFLEVSGGT